MKKIYLSGNYIIYEVDGTIQKTIPANKAFYEPTDTGYILKVIGDKYQIDIKTADLATQWVDIGDSAYTASSMEAFLRNSTGFSTALGGSRAELFLSELKMLDGTATDIAPFIQAAIERVKVDYHYRTIRVPKGDYVIDSNMVIDTELHIDWGGSTINLSTSVAEFFAFTKTDDSDLKMNNLVLDATTSTSVNGVKFLNVTGTFPNSHIELFRCEYSSYQDEISNMFLVIDDGISGKKVSINECLVNDSVLFFYDLDSVNQIEELVIDGNIANNCPRWFLRSQQFSGSANSTVKNAWVRNNRVKDLNGNLVDVSGQVARFVQVEVEENMYCDDNTFDGSETDTSGNAIYMNGGNLFFRRNTVRNTQGAANTAVIDDKGDTTHSFWTIEDNVFDYTGLDHTAVLNQAIIRILAQPNTKIEGNQCSGLLMPLAMVYQSINNGQWPKNISIQDNDIYSIDYPVAIILQQDMEGITIDNNRVHEMTNSDGINVIGLTHRRMVAIYQTFNNAGGGAKAVTISNNVFRNADSRMYLVQTWINAAAPTAEMDGIFITDNKCYGIPASSALCYFTNSTGDLVNNMLNVVVRNNIAPGMTEDQGIRPSTVVQEGNTL